MEKHFDICSGRPGPSRPKKARECLTGTDEDSGPDVTDAAGQGEPDGKLPGAEPERKTVMPTMRQPRLTAWVVNTNSVEKEKIDNVVAEFFYGCNVPFSVVEHPLFKQLIDSLRPGYKPPNRKLLAGPLLDK